MKTFILKSINQLKSVLKSIFKIVLWIVGIVIVLLLFLALLLRLPFIQNKLVSEVADLLSKKTHSEIKLKKLTINLPGSFNIEGLLIKDLHKDTLVYAQEININLELKALLKKHFHITSVNVNSVTAKLYRPVNDTNFNFNFLIEAFADTTQKKPQKKIILKKNKPRYR